MAVLFRLLCRDTCHGYPACFFIFLLCLLLSFQLSLAFKLKTFTAFLLTHLLLSCKLLLTNIFKLLLPLALYLQAALRLLHFRHTGILRHRQRFAAFTLAALFPAHRIGQRRIVVIELLCTDKIAFGYYIVPVLIFLVFHSKAACS